MQETSLTTSITEETSLLNEVNSLVKRGLKVVDITLVETSAVAHIYVDSNNQAVGARLKDVVDSKMVAVVLLDTGEPIYFPIKCNVVKAAYIIGRIQDYLEGIQSRRGSRVLGLSASGGCDEDPSAPFLDV